MRTLISTSLNICSVLLALTPSPKILLRAEKVDSARHLFPYPVFSFHFFVSEFFVFSHTFCAIWGIHVSVWLWFYGFLYLVGRPFFP